MKPALPVCRRCGHPHHPTRGHTCQGMVPNRDIQILVRVIRELGLNHVLSELVGTDEARLLVREAWVRLDDSHPVFCPSCSHPWDIHADDGCWYTVAAGRPEKNAVCQCRIRRDGTDPLEVKQ